MRLIAKLYLSFGLVLAVVVATVVMSFWSVREASFHL